NFFYFIAAAPHFGSSSLDNNPYATGDHYINGWSGSTNTQKYCNASSLASRYGMASMVYEGGTATFGGSNITTKRNASLDPRMRELVTRYLNNWYNQGGGLFMWF